MTKAEEILEKHLANNIDQRTYLRGSKLTYDICIDALNEAINYTRCCTELKDKEVLTFEEWLSNFEKTEDNNYWLNKEVLYCKEAMLLHYNDLPDE